jgi:hypothetical protein
MKNGTHGDQHTMRKQTGIEKKSTKTSSSHQCETLPTRPNMKVRKKTSPVWDVSATHVARNHVKKSLTNKQKT